MLPEWCLLGCWGSDTYPLSGFQSAFSGLEVNGQQSDDLADASFVDEATLNTNVSNRDDLYYFVNNASSAEVLILLALDLDIKINSICLDGADQTFADTFVDAYGHSVPIAIDFEGTTSKYLDIGAFDEHGLRWE